MVSYVCPQCDAQLMNTQGVEMCPECGWSELDRQRPPN
jgi:DNA-directed RNA polymerase subunit RPC12/RpoP